MLFLNKIPGGADLEPQKALSKIISLEKHSHRKAAIAKPIRLPKSVQNIKFKPKYELMQKFEFVWVWDFNEVQALSVYKPREQRQL